MRDRRFRTRFPFRFPTVPATKDCPCRRRPKGVSRSGKTPLPAPADYVWKGLRKRARIETETQVRQLQERPRGKPASKLPPELAAAASWSPAGASTAESPLGRGHPQLLAAASLGRRAPPPDHPPPAQVRPTEPACAAPGDPEGHPLVRHSAADRSGFHADRGTRSSPVERRTARCRSTWETHLPLLSTNERCRTAIPQTGVSAISSHVSGPE